MSSSFSLILPEPQSVVLSLCVSSYLPKSPPSRSWLCICWIELKWTNSLLVFSSFYLILPGSPICCFVPPCLQLSVSSFQNLVVYLLNWIEMNQYSTFHCLLGVLPIEATYPFSQYPPFWPEIASHGLFAWARNFPYALWDSYQEPISWIDGMVFIHFSSQWMVKSHDLLLSCSVSSFVASF